MRDRSSFFTENDAAIRVEVTAARGSTPRAAGTAMYVSVADLDGTIGGGRLEFNAIEHAREMLETGLDRSRMEVPLGPEIGQCCGGFVEIGFTRMDAAALQRAQAEQAAERANLPAVYIFGAGHVGRALADAFALLPVRTVLVDEREHELEQCGAPARRCLTPLPEAEVRAAPPGSAFVVLTHDHALDFIIAAEALMRGDAVYVGMIGSKTKRASFESWCRKSNAGIGRTDALVCPIGNHGSRDKRPEVIAAFVVAEVVARLTAEASPGEVLAADDRSIGESE